ncbi:demethylmenaquinone methyltransferase-like [Saccostrea cucullata]|uniref:demethylmenaquinone methyltransferase-like n=1 Tax=Saccostrea cuccullata TaxID=36930 RepID=UPI002ED4A10C
MSNLTNYNEVSKVYDCGRKAFDGHVLKSTMENFTEKKFQEMDIIDIGSGTGNFSEYFTQFEPRSLTLLDASEGMLNKARAKVKTPSNRTQLTFKQAVLPEIPYKDNSFDAGMINHVVHHLEKNPDGDSYPVLLKTLKQVYRILKPGGVLTIITDTPENLEGNWFVHLVPGAMKKWHKLLPTHKQMKDMLKDSGFTLKSAFRSLMMSYFPVYGDLDGPLHESWRNLNSFWDVCTDTEIQNMVRKVTQMKEEGTLKKYFESHHKIDSTGAYEIFVVKKEL